MMRGLAERLDEDAWDAQKAGDDAQHEVLFRRSRAVSSLAFALSGEPDEAIYEAAYARWHARGSHSSALAVGVECRVASVRQCPPSGSVLTRMVSPQTMSRLRQHAGLRNQLPCGRLVMPYACEFRPWRHSGVRDAASAWLQMSWR